jgi:DNA-binding PadR family transcriptional regulator
MYNALRKLEHEGNEGRVAMAEITRTDLLLLGLLMDHPMHGYELHQKIQGEGIDRWFNLSLPGIYYSLGKLRDRGYAVEMRHPRSSGAARATYRVTEQGRQIFFAALETEAASQERPYLDYDLVVYFLNKLPIARAESMLEERQRYLEKWEQELLGRQAEAEAEDVPMLRRALLEHARLYARMEQEWTDCLLRGIRGEPVFAGGSTSLMLLRGDLDRYHLPDLVRLIASGRQSGTLTLTDGVVTRTITFQEGRLVCATSSRRASEGEDVFAPDHEEVMADLYDLFRWQEGKFTFDQATGPSVGCMLLKISAEAFLLEGCRWVDNWETLQKLVPSPDAVFERVAPATLGEGLDLDANEAILLAAVDGVRSVAQIAQGSGMTLFEGSRVLYGLSAVGLVRLARLDKIRLRRAFREISELVCRSTTAWRASPQDFSCELEVNQAAAELPIRINRSRIEDDTDPQLDGKDLAQVYRDFLSIQLSVIRTRFGPSAARSSYDGALQRLAPELSKIAHSHKLTGLLPPAARNTA